NTDSVFYSTEEFPVLVPDGDSVTLKIVFAPDTIGNYSTLITINSDINTDTLIQRVAQQMVLKGKGSLDQSGIDESFGIKARVYPSPVNDMLTIEVLDNDPETSLSLYDISGKLFYSSTVPEDGKIVIDMNTYKPGLYFVQLKATLSGKSGYYKIIKD
ncbi:MAG: T9SS type A sorting domain-containing protein, partial [Chlorobi bacterium]|nr:T9SS type A sorting domain-containing protein [Chlorobiota bacterium]